MVKKYRSWTSLKNLEWSLQNSSRVPYNSYMVLIIFLDSPDKNLKFKKIHLLFFPALGYPRGFVQANFPRPRERHQRCHGKFLNVYHYFPQSILIFLRVNLYPAEQGRILKVLLREILGNSCNDISRTS